MGHSAARKKQQVTRSPKFKYWNKRFSRKYNVSSVKVFLFKTFTYNAQETYILVWHKLLFCHLPAMSSLPLPMLWLTFGTHEWPFENCSGLFRRRLAQILGLIPWQLILFTVNPALLWDTIAREKGLNTLQKTIPGRLASKTPFIQLFRERLSEKTMHATIPKGNVGYDQRTFFDTVAVESTFVAFL